MSDAAKSFTYIDKCKGFDRITSVDKKVEHVGAIVQKRKLVRSKELRELSLSRSHLWNLAQAGKIERVGHGLYRAKNSPISAYETLLEVAKRVPSGVLCL